MLTAADLMTHDLETVDRDDSISYLIERVAETRHGGLPVRDEAGRVVGLVTQDDVLRSMAFLVAGEVLPREFGEHRREIAARLLALERDVEARIGRFLEAPVLDVMTHEVIGCAPNTPLPEVCRLMSEHGVHRVVVIGDDGSALGLVSMTDIVRHVASGAQGATP